MNTDGDLNPIIEDHIRWLEQVLTRADSHGPTAIYQAINDLDDQHAKALLLIQLRAEHEDRKRAREIIAKQNAAPLN
jgi:hypothetical protein